jgi:hypothetical protein
MKMIFRKRRFVLSRVTFFLSTTQMARRRMPLTGHSRFDETHGIHADGVSEDTSVLPSLWRERLIPYKNANTNGVTGLCLERHDLCVAKLVANREKDRAFVRDLLRGHVVELDVIIDRLMVTDISDERLQQITEFVRANGPGAEGGDQRGL